MSQDQIQLPEPVGIVAPRPDVVDWFSYEPEIGTELHEAATVRRLIAEAVAAEREACAKACEDRAGTVSMFANSKDARENNRAVRGCAAAIRSRGDQT